VTIGKREQVGVREQGDGGRPERRVEKGAKAGVEGAVGDAHGEHPALGEECAGAERRLPGIGELVEGVPDGHRVVAAPRLEARELAGGDAEAERAHEAVDRLVDVEPLDAPAAVARRAEEGADVAPDLQHRARAPEHGAKAPLRRVVRPALRLVQRAQDVGRRRGGIRRVHRAQLVRPLARVAEDEPAAATLHDAQRRRVREGDAVGEMLRGRPRPEPPPVEVPEQLDLASHRVRIGDHPRVVASADGTGGRLEVGRGHGTAECSGRAGR
jgi:hypothetical protein